jgi:hypothetical protein
MSHAMKEKIPEFLGVSLNVKTIANSRPNRQRRGNGASRCIAEQASSPRAFVVLIGWC